MAPTTNYTGRAAVVLFALLALFALDKTAEALPFTGSPVLSYNQPLYMYAAQWNSYCKYDGQGIACNVSITDPTQATRFYISGGCGSIVASNTAVNSFAIYPNSGGNSWFFVLPAQNDATLTIYGDYAIASYQFTFSNYVPVSDGLLHGNATEVQWSVPGDGWCSAQPTTSNNGHVQCNRATVSAWEAFYFVPA